MSLNLTSSQLRRAADLTEKIESLQNELNELLGSPAASNGAAGTPGKRQISAAGIARIRAAQKARWAKAKAGAPAAAKPGKRGPRKMSASARARIAAAQKARWAKFHAAKGGK